MNVQGCGGSNDGNNEDDVSGETLEEVQEVAKEGLECGTGHSNDFNLGCGYSHS